MALVEALVADGWHPDDAVLQQVEVDRLTLSLPQQAGAPQDDATLVA